MTATLRSSRFAPRGHAVRYGQSKIEMARGSANSHRAWTEENVPPMPDTQSNGPDPARTSVRPEPRRYPLRPLLARVGRSQSDACRLLGISGRAQQRYLPVGVTEKVAERLARKAGFLAYEIWPEMVEHSIEACSIQCAGPNCTEKFVPLASQHRYHHPDCRQAAATDRRRARYHTDTEYAARRRRQAAAYYAECGDYVRARVQRYDAARRGQAA